MAITLVQQANSAASAAAATSASVTLTSPTTSGNLVVVAVAVDKNAGTFTASGLTNAAVLDSTSVSLYVGYKITTGNETTFTVSWTGPNPTGARIAAFEYADSGTGNWVVSVGQHPTDETGVLSWSSGTASLPLGYAAAAAFFAVDSAYYQAGSGTWSNGFTSILAYDTAAPNGRAGLAVGHNLSVAGASIETTRTATGTADQTSAAILAFARDGGGGALLTDDFEDASTIGTVSGWYDSAPYYGYPSATLSRSSDHAYAGFYSMRVDYADSPSFAVVGRWVYGAMVIGQSYTMTARVWVPTGSPAVRLDGLFETGAQSVYSTTHDQWELLSVTFVHSSVVNRNDADIFVGVNNAPGPSVAGQRFYVDSFSLTVATTPPSGGFSQTPTNSAGVTDAGQQIIATPSSGGASYSQVKTEFFISDLITTSAQIKMIASAGATLSATASTGGTGNAYSRAATDGEGITDAGQVIYRSPAGTTDSMGLTDTATPDKTTPPSGNVALTITDDMGIDEPLTETIDVHELIENGVGAYDAPPDRQIGSLVQYTLTPVESVSPTPSDVVSWQTWVGGAQSRTVTDSAVSLDTITTQSGSSQAPVMTNSAGLTDSFTYTLGVAQRFWLTVTEAGPFYDTPFAYRPDQVGLHLEIKSVDRATGQVRGPVPDRTELTLSPVFCDVGAVTFKYRRGGINADWVAVDEEFAVFLNDTEIGDLRFVVDETSDNDAAEDEWMTVAGRSTLSLLEQAVVYPGSWPTTDPPSHTFTAATPGTILTILISRAKARGSILDIGTSTFSEAVDSNGAAWTEHVTVTFDAGTNYLKVVQALVEMGAIEVRMAARELIVLNPGTLMVDRTVQDSPLVFRTGASIVDSPRKESTRDLRTALLVAGKDNVYVEVSDSTAVAVYGRREGYENQGGVGDTGTLTSYGQTKLTGTSEPKMEKTHGLTFVEPTSPRPWFDFRLGDWVYNDYGNGTLERLRIKQWTIKEEANGILSGTVTLNDLFSEKIERLSKELDKIVSGATVVGGSEPPPDTGGDEGDITPPGVPQNITIESSTYTDPSGIVLAQVTLSWSAVDVDAMGNPATDVDHYEIELSYQSATGIWSPVGSTSDTVLFYSPARPGAEIWVHIRAVDTTGNVGAWSSAIHGLIASDNQPPPEPPAAEVAPYLGQLKITWDGLGAAGEAMPDDFKWVEVHISTVNDFTPSLATLLDILNSAGSTIATDLIYDTPYYVKLVAVDTSNNKSDPGIQATGTPTRIVSTDMSNIENASITTTWMDDFESYDARWSKVAGVSTQQVISLTDGISGGSALAVAGDGTYEWGQNITFDPDVLYRVKARVRAIGGTSVGKQYIAAGTYGSFENDVNGWATLTDQTSTCARSLTRAQEGVASMLVTWGGQSELIGATIGNLTVGHTYTFSAYVWVPTGSAAVRLNIYGNATSAASTTTNTWQRLIVTFTATATSHWVAVQHVPATSGSAIELQESFETGVSGFYASGTGGTQTSDADLDFDASTVGQVPSGWTAYTSYPAQNTSWLSSNWLTSTSNYVSAPNGVLVQGTMVSASTDQVAAMRTTSPYQVTPGQQVTVTAKFKQSVGQVGQIVSGLIAIATSATTTPPTATGPLFGSNPGFQNSGSIYLSDSIGQWVPGTATFTIPTGHTYCWVIIGENGWVPSATGTTFAVAVDDVTFSGAAPAAPPVLESSTDRAYTGAGTHSLKTTWNAPSQSVSKDLTLSAGTQHCASAYVYVPVGSPAVTISASRTTSTGAVTTVTGSSTTTTGSWERIWVAVIPQAGDSKLSLVLANGFGAGTAYVDALQVEVGSTPTAYVPPPAPVLGTVYVDAAMVEEGTIATAFSTLMAGTGRLVSVGLMGIAADGVSRVSPTGSAAITMHPVAASTRDPGENTWTTYEGFVKGRSASGQPGAADDLTSRDASTPGVMQFGTRYIRPAFAVNQVGGTGLTQVDMMTIEVLAFPSNVIQDFMVANMSAGKITAGAINAVLIVSEGKIVSGNPTGARVEMNKSGLYAYTASGEREFWLDALTGSATFSGTLLASTFKTADPPYPRIEISGDFAQRIDCYPDMTTTWISPPGFRAGEAGQYTIEIFGGQSSAGTGGRITASFPNQPLTNPWTGGVDAYGSRITINADQTEFLGASTGGRILVGNTSGQGWIDRPYSGYVRAAVALVSGLAHGAGVGAHPPYNSLEIRSTPIKDLYLIKGAFQVYGGYLGDGSTVGSLPAGFPAPARTQIIPAINNWDSQSGILRGSCYLEISTSGYIYLHGIITPTTTTGYTVKVNGMYDTY